MLCCGPNHPVHIFFRIFRFCSCPVISYDTAIGLQNTVVYSKIPQWPRYTLILRGHPFSNATMVGVTLGLYAFNFLVSNFKDRLFSEVCVCTGVVVLSVYLIFIGFSMLTPEQSQHCCFIA